MSGKKKQRGTVRACLITSARSGHGHFDPNDAMQVLLAQGWDVAMREKQEKGDAVTLAQRAAHDGYDPIVNCGGDGTLNEIVEALVDTDVAIGTIPGGTANVWCQEVGISTRSRVAAMQLVAARRVRVDAGKVEINGKHARHFLMMAGLGADAAVMERVSRPLKNRLGPLAVGAAAVESMPAFKAAPVEVEFDGTTWRGAAGELIIGNTRRYGGFTSITPEARADDALLDLCIFTTSGVWGTLQQLTTLLVRQRPNESSAEIYRAARITVRAGTAMPLQLDGSSIHLPDGEGRTEYTFSVLPKALTMLLPPAYDGALFLNGHASNGHVPSKEGRKPKHKDKHA